MTRRRIALLLTALVAASGVLPLLLLAMFGLQILRQRGERASQEALHAIATQAAARIGTYIAQQREMLRTIGTAVADEADAARRLADVSLDAPSLGKLRLVSAETPARELPRMLSAAQIASALRANEVASETYIAELSPAMDVCAPPASPVAPSVRRSTCSSSSGRCSASASASRGTRSPSTARDGWSPPAPARCEPRCSAASRSPNPRSPPGW